MDAISWICFTVSVIVGGFIGHMIYDIYKAHKAHKDSKKRKIGKNAKYQIKK